MPHEPANILAPWSAHLAQASGLPVVLGSSPPPEALRSARAHRDSVDLRLWLEACRAAPAPEGVPAGEGPLLAWDQSVAIEVWTECELAALHALARFARHPDPAIASFSGERTAEAIRWHLEHTQPDNATNRPWALHAFLLAEDGSGEPTAYAGKLLHNRSATEARNEPLSLWILADAARELRLRGFGAA
mgnify:CR=1 FL=1